MAVYAYNLKKGKEGCHTFKTSMSHRVKPCLKSKEDRSEKDMSCVKDINADTVVRFSQ